MAKYDAFGREIGEDPLASLRNDEGRRPDPVPVADEPARPRPAGREDGAEPAPAMSAGPAADQHAAPSQTPQMPTFEVPEFRVPATTGRAARRIFLLVVFAVVIGPIAAGVVAVVGEIDDTADVVKDGRDLAGRIREAVEQPSGAPASGRPAAPDRPAVGLQRGSFLTRAELAPALRKLRRLGAIRSLRLAPDRIQAQVVKGTTMRIVHVEPGGAVREITSVPGAGAAGTTIDVGRLDPAGPYRLVRSAAGRLKVPTTRIDYVLAWGDGWNAYFKDGAGIFQGDARGRVVRRIS